MAGVAAHATGAGNDRVYDARLRLAAMSIGNGDDRSEDEDSAISDDVPSNASPAERAALDRTRTVARLLDEAIPVPGLDYRIGLDSIVGLLPVSGDLVTGVVGLYIVGEAARAGAPREILGRMVGNLVIDVAIGSVPAIGDLFDAAWKANVKNVELFAEYLEEEH
jgi:hypothetical protein